MARPRRLSRATITGLVQRLHGPPRPGVAAETRTAAIRWVHEQHIVLVATVWILFVILTPLVVDARAVGKVAGFGYLLVAVYGLQVVSIDTAQPSLGHAAFMAVGAYITAAMRLRAGWDGIPAAVVAGVGAGLAGFVVAWGISRLRPAMTALATWSFGWLVILAIGAYPEITGGGGGIALADPLRLRVGALGIDAGVGERGHLILASLVLAIVVLLYQSARRSSLGLSWLTLREGTALGRSLGYDVARLRRWSFAAGAGVAGIAGALLAQLLGVVDPTTFSPQVSLTLFAAVLIGSSLGILGPLVGLVVTSGLPAAVSSVGDAVGVSVDRGRGIISAALVIVGLLVALRPSPRAAPVMAATGPGRKPAETPGAPTPIPYQIAPRRDPTGDDGPVLVCEGLFRSFGGVQALRGVDLRLDAGRLHGLIGPNGSGKSTLLRCLSGTLRCDCGRMLHRDVDITALDEVARARAGIVRTFARTAVLAGLTAADHAAIGLQRSWPESGWMRAVLKTPRYRDEAERRQAAATRLLAVVGLDELAGRDPLTLSAGRQRLLQLAATLGTRPSVVLLDEPSAGMQPDELTLLEAALLSIRAASVSVLIVEHNMRFLGRVADQVTVLSEGIVLVSGTPADVAADAAVRAVYLG